MPRIQTKLKVGLTTTAILAAGIGVFSVVEASASSHSVMAVQPTGAYVFACVNEVTGKMDYFEFKQPLPHQCRAGDELWHLAAGPVTICASPSPSPSATPTATATATATATPSPSPSATPTPCLTPAAAPSPSPCPTATATATATPTATATATPGWWCHPSPNIFASSGLGTSAPLSSPEPSTS
jgi:hypothetical protein